MENFIKRHANIIEEVPTATVFQLWIEEYPYSGYNTIYKLSKALKQYGYKTKVQSYSTGRSRRYMRTRVQSPITIVCDSCGHQHTHITDNTK